LTGLQTCSAKGKRSTAGRGFIAIAACNRYDETAILRIIDRRSGIGAEEARNDDIAYFDQISIIRTGEFSAGVTLGRHVIQTDGDHSTLAHIHACWVDNRDDGRLARIRIYLPNRENIETTA